MLIEWNFYLTTSRIHIRSVQISNQLPWKWETAFIQLKKKTRLGWEKVKTHCSKYLSKLSTDTQSDKFYNKMMFEKKKLLLSQNFESWILVVVFPVKQPKEKKVTVKLASSDDLNVSG